MITASVCYPKTSQSRFDHVYYLQKHMPLVNARWRDFGLRSVQLFRGTGELGGGAPAFELIGLLTFTSLEDLQSALAHAGDEIIGDIPNFTDVQPVIQLNEAVQQI